MRIPRRPTGTAAAKLDDTVSAARREAAKVDLDPLDGAMLSVLKGLSEAMQEQAEGLDALRQRMVRLGQETLG